MPDSNDCMRSMELARSEFIDCRRRLLALVVDHSVAINRPGKLFCLDDCIIILIVASIGPSEPSMQSQIPYWLSFLMYATRMRNFEIEDQAVSRATLEEHRRSVCHLHWHTQAHMLTKQGSGGRSTILTVMLLSHWTPDLLSRMLSARLIYHAPIMYRRKICQIRHLLLDTPYQVWTYLVFSPHLWGSSCLSM